LEENHASLKNVCLAIFRKHSATPSVAYDEAVGEVSCFGWIDSNINKRGGESSYQFFAKRNPKSKWSLANRNKIARLAAEGRIAPAGQKRIGLPKKRAHGQRSTTWRRW